MPEYIGANPSVFPLDRRSSVFSFHLVLVFFYGYVVFFDE